MKKLLFSAVTILAFIGVSCTRQAAESPVSDSGKEIVIHARCSEVDPSTRTVRQEDGKVFWSPGDKIGVFYGTNQPQGGALFISQNSSAQPTADFIGTLPSGSGDYWGLYPYQQQSWRYGDDYVVTSFTNEQTAVDGSFPDNLYVALARSSTTDLSFSHPLGGIKFSLVSEGVTRITMTSNGGEAIACNQFLLSYTGGQANVADYNVGYDTITLVPESGVFKAGENYYFVTIPVNMASGFTLTMERNDGKILRRNVNKAVVVSRASFRVLPEADKGYGWEDAKLEYTPSEVSIGPKGGTFDITVTTYGSYHVDINGCDWIEAAGTDGDARFGCAHHFKVKPNTGAQRVGLISVCDASNCYPVVVTQADGTHVKEITHHSLGMRFTATWCGYCPRMNTSFAMAKEVLGDRFMIVNLHGSGSDLYFSAAAPLLTQYQISGFPSGIVDGRVLIQNYNESYTSSLVQQAVQESEENYPAKTGLGISSSVSGRQADVKVKLYASEAGQYKLTVLLVEDGIVGYQADFVNGAHNDYVHNRTARMCLSGSALGDQVNVAAADSETELSFSATIPSGYSIDKMSVLAFVQAAYGTQAKLGGQDYGDWYIDNCRDAALGTTVQPEVK